MPILPSDPNALPFYDGESIVPDPPENPWFDARLIEKATGTGLLGGLTVWGWKEFTPNAALAEYEDKIGGRRGTVSTSPHVNPALPYFGSAADVGDLVRMRLRGVNSEGPVYEFLNSKVVAPLTATCNGCGWAAGIETYDCFRVTVVRKGGKCDCINDGQEDILRYSVPDDAWVSVTNTFDSCTETNQQIAFYKEDGELKLTYSGETLYLQCCEPNVAYFDGGTSVFCDDPRNGFGPDGNTFRLKVEWMPRCPTPGWNGSGWYCVEILSVRSCQNYPADPGAGPTFLYGPFPDVTTCNVPCTGSSVPDILMQSCCPGTPSVPTTLYAFLGPDQGPCNIDDVFIAGITHSTHPTFPGWYVELNWNGTVWYGEATANNGGTVTFALSPCDSLTGKMNMAVTACGFRGTAIYGVFTCSGAGGFHAILSGGMSVPAPGCFKCLTTSVTGTCEELPVEECPFLPSFTPTPSWVRANI